VGARAEGSIWCAGNWFIERALSAQTDRSGPRRAKIKRPVTPPSCARVIAKSVRVEGDFAIRRQAVLQTLGVSSGEIRVLGSAGSTSTLAGPFTGAA
jgi:hypothetical protein